MKLLKSKLSLAIAAGILSGPALAAPINCTLTPANSVITQGETLQLAATCEGGPLASITWKQGATALTGAVLLSGDTSKPIYYTTPAGAAGDFIFTVLGVPVNGTDTFGASSEARVLINATASAFGATTTPSAPTTPVDAFCGTANSTTVAAMPTTSQCNPGKVALAVSSPQGFSWSCLSLTGGAEASCYAMREGYVAPSTTTSSTTTSSTTTPSTTTSSTTTSSTTTAPSTASGDPGIGSGLWVPPNTTNRTVADQSSSSMNVSYVPGCLNDQFAKDSSSGCATKDSYSGVSLGSSKELVLRYKTPSSVTNGKNIKVGAWNGGNVGVNMRVWLSKDPTATYASVPDASCKASSSASPSITTGVEASVTTTSTVWGQTTTTTKYYCKLDPDAVYYFGIAFDEARTGTGARFQVDELSADFLP